MYATTTFALPEKERTPVAYATRVRRRVIEGEGLGGFARRYLINSAVVIPFRRDRRIFSVPRAEPFFS